MLFARFHISNPSLHPRYHVLVLDNLKAKTLVNNYPRMAVLPVRNFWLLRVLQDDGGTLKHAKASLSTQAIV